MRVLLLVAVLAVLVWVNLPGTAAQSICPNAATWYTVKGFQTLTVSTAAVALTIPAGADWAVLNVEAQPIRWRQDGTDPSGAVGMLVAAGATMAMCGRELNVTKFIRASTATGDAILSIHFY